MDDEETTRIEHEAVLRLIMDLRPFSVEARARILASAGVFLGVLAPDQVAAIVLQGLRNGKAAHG